MSNPEGRPFRSRFRPYRARVLGASTLALVEAAFLIPIPILIGKSIDEAIPDRDTRLMVIIALVMAGSSVISVLARIWARAVDFSVTMRVSEGLRRDVYAKLIALPRSSYDETSTTDLHDRVVNDTLRVQTMASVLITTLLPTAVLTAGISIVLVYLNWRLALVTLAFAPVMFVTGRMMTGRIRHAADAFHPAYRDFSAAALRMLRSQDMIRLAGAERQELQSAEVQLRELRRTNTRVAFLSSLNPAFQQGIIATAGAALLAAGGVIVINDSMTLGELLAFYAGFAMLRGPAGGFATSYSQIVEGQQALTRVQALLADPIERPYRGTDRIGLVGHLELRNAVFAYDGQNPVVRDVSLELAPGRIVALIGPNGSGKSSIVNLLLGFYRPSQGEVLADGVPYAELDMSVLRPQLGVVTQNPFLFPGTVRQNIVYGKEYTDRELDAVVVMSGVDRVVEMLPNGLETDIGDDGARLSGGQRQRIAIARALLGRPRVLIFDEPTNHLDDSAVSTLLQNIRRLGSQIAVLIVSHHDVVLEDADVTIELRDGAVVSRTDANTVALQPVASHGRVVVAPGTGAASLNGSNAGYCDYRLAVAELIATGVLTNSEASALQRRADALTASTKQSA